MKIIYRSVDILALGAGTLGVFLPLLPTSCFVLLVPGCFAKSSPRGHAWLQSNPLPGST
ncbi:DUF454 family protein [Motiliproteus sp. MSK22-1]|uniref:DUF454 family protein n=1 Tax=Motiliproteus sp. MSK22-1 TaxID=1897630 RepID=UPI0009F850CC